MADKPQVSLRDIGYIILFSTDVLASAAFYRDKLGIPVRFENKEWTELDTNGPTIALHRCDEPLSYQGPALPDVTFKVADVLATHRELQSRGVPISPPKKVHDAGPMVGVSAMFRDPDGNRLSIYGLVPAAGWTEPI